jgi:hypothetical protein
MAMNKDTQELLVESVSFYTKDQTLTLKDQLDEGKTDIELMKKIVKLEELKQSLMAKNSNE